MAAKNDSPTTLSSSKQPSLSPPLSQNGNPSKSSSSDSKDLSSSIHTPIPPIQNSFRRSPRLLDYGSKIVNSSKLNGSAKKQKTAEFSMNKKTEKGQESCIVSFFIGDPVPDDEARLRWPWRYQNKVLRSNGRISKHNDNDDDEDELVLNVKCHYSQAEIEKCIFNIGDCAYTKGREGDQNYVGKILEFFKTVEGEDYFRVQWFFRTEDTIIKDEATSHDKKRLFYSTLMNDNFLDCIVSKVKVVQIAPSVNSESKLIPSSDFYYDMKYSVDYSTFSTLLPDNAADGSDLSSPPHMMVVHTTDTRANFDGISSHQPLKSELYLLDMYSGCGGMSTGLCLGAKLCGIDLVTKWAVDNDKSACETLKLNHPETQIRNEPAEDFLDLVKEWDKLCKRYAMRNAETQEPNFSATRSDIPSITYSSIPTGEYEVARLVDICYGDPTETGKRGLKFQVRWVGYGPSEDTWEPIEGLSNCEDRIQEFVWKGIKTKILPRPGEVDCICGGPPCQGISGYNRFRNVDSPLDDERNRQIVVFMEIVNFLRPKYILMENVADILRFAKGCLGRYALSCLVRMNYQARIGIMAAGCYGLPQFRLRVFLWGAHPNERLPQFPLPTHDVVLKYGAPSQFQRNIVAYDEGQSQDLEKPIVLSDAISDLPPVPNHEIRDKMSYRRDPETEFQKYIRASKSDMMGFVSSDSTGTEKSVLFDHRPLPLNDDDYLRVCRILPKKGANFRDLPGIVVGCDNVVQRTAEHSLMPSGKPWVPDWAINFCEGKSARPFARLWWDETVPTLLCRPDCHCQAILHPEQDRVLTVRECARLQGFHDHYEFCGDVKDRYCQVGNAVAVSVGRALGYTLGMAVRKLSGDEPLMKLPPKFSHSTTIQLQSLSSQV